MAGELPTRIEAGALAGLGDELRALGVRRVLLVTGASRRHVGRALEALADLPARVFPGARTHVPQESVDAARAALELDPVDGVVALGGGAAIGLAKALRLERPALRFVAVPTTYAGSEQTAIWGRVEPGGKRTGRDESVRPDLVLYDPDLVESLPRRVAVQSLVNALAHPVGALAAGPADDAARGRATRAVARAWTAALELASGPASTAARLDAFEAAAAAGAVLDEGAMGAQHRVAHRLGGRFSLEHAALHAALLPSFLAGLEGAPAFEDIRAAMASPDPAADLFDLLVRVGAPTALRAFGVAWPDVADALADDPALEATRGWVRRAWLGDRPSSWLRREDWGLSEPVVLGGADVPTAARVVVALHGRDGSAGAAARDALDLAAWDPGVAVVAPQAQDGRWSEAAVDEAGRVLARLAEAVDPARLVVLGAGEGGAAARRLAEGRALGVLLAFDGDEDPPSMLVRIEARERLLGRPSRVGRRGFGGVHESEALPGALPPGQNSPRRAPYGLYAEQVNATAFHAPRDANVRSWTYRIRPSAQQGPLEPLDHGRLVSHFASGPAEPNLAGWRPLPIPLDPTDFVDGLVTLGGAGAPELRRGYAVHLYAANESMDDRAFSNADGDLLLVPELGAVTLVTDVGLLAVRPGQVAVLPRGMRFSVLLEEPSARGWVGEVFGRGFRLPERGPIGANGLTEPRHFRRPEAWFEDRLTPDFRVTVKHGGGLFEARQDHSPWDVVAWHGNWTPYVYDLADFIPAGFARVDHVDPSVHVVLTAPLDDEGADALDLVVFTPRWDATEHTFRPPYFHRNVTTELNGIVREPGAGAGLFEPGTTFLTPSMTPHGVLARGVERHLALDDDLADRPHRSTDTSLWFQLESSLPIRLTPWARSADTRLPDWPRRWGVYRPHFTPRPR